MQKEISKRVAVLVGFLITIVVGYTIYIRHDTERRMTLAEALWVSTAEMKTNFSPGSPQSLMILHLMSGYIDTNTFRTSSFIYYRLPVGESLSEQSPAEPLSVDD